MGDEKKPDATSRIYVIGAEPAVRSGLAYLESYALT